MKKLIALIVVVAVFAAMTGVAQASSYSSGSCTKGKFKVTFSGAKFVTGLGWSTGSGGTINFSGSCSGCNFGPGVYGWKTSPLMEYYIGKGSGTKKGSYSCDGRGYTLYVLRRTNAPSIQGTASFDQLNASGSRSSPVNFGCHSYNWQKLGMPAGTHNYQVVAVENWSGGSGSATVSVSGSNWYTHWVGSGSATFTCGG
jgi:endo-1,4-beta-xylanase